MGAAESSEGVDRLERLANLVFLLLHTRKPLTIREICDQVAGYPPAADPVALRQRFERDKKVLRDEGIDIRVEQVPDDTQLGYIIREADYFLPDLLLTPDEQSALAIAVAGVHVDDSSSRDALSKLGIVTSQSPALTANLPASPLLPVLHEAVRGRTAVTIAYHGRRRAVDPYGLLCRGGVWYLFGWDHDHAERRTYRVDRIEGEVVAGEPGTFEVPEGFDPSTELPAEPWKIGDGDGFTARVEIGPVMAPLVSEAIAGGHLHERRADGSIVLSLDVVNPDALRTWVLGMAQHARVLDPPDLVREVVVWLDRMVEVGKPEGEEAGGAQ